MYKGGTRQNHFVSDLRHRAMAEDVGLRLRQPGLNMHHLALIQRGRRSRHRVRRGVWPSAGMTVSPYRWFGGDRRSIYAVSQLGSTLVTLRKRTSVKLKTRDSCS